MKDSIGDRMKNNYENRTRYYLPRRTYTIIRIDGKAFHTFTKDLEKPFSPEFMNLMDYTAQKLVEEIQGAKFAYVQSDEISILLTDFENTTTDAWFDGNIQKMCSVSASIATAYFNSERHKSPKTREKPPAMFDSRVFTIPEWIEVTNYFIWRQQDCTRNSIQSVGQANFSHKELQGKSCNEIQEMLFTERGINWNNLNIDCKRGRIITKEGRLKDIPIFTEDREFLSNLTKADDDSNLDSSTTS